MRRTTREKLTPFAPLPHPSVCYRTDGYEVCGSNIVGFGVLGLIGLIAGCMVGPREGYYDGNHHRYYHENGWHDCADRDEHCH
jgi:hypothetical protein